MSDHYQELLKEFKNIDYKKIKNNIFQELELDAYCFNVHDTDTISVLFKYNQEVIKYNIRLMGLDAPELKSKDLNERELCIKGTEYLKQLILNKLIKVKTYKTDKYGRMLGSISTLDTNPININEDLIKKGYCREYYGDAKKDWNLIDSNPLPSINKEKTVEINIISPLESNKPRRRYIRRCKKVL